MAGGVNAAVVPCLKCAGRADRTSVGQEDDHYRCAECGFEFGIDWSYDGPPQSPRWPVSSAESDTRVRLEAEYRDTVRRSLPRPHGAADYLLRADYVATQTDGQLRDFIRDFSPLAGEEDELKRLLEEAVDRVLAGVPAAVQAALEKIRAEEKGLTDSDDAPAKTSEPE